uniref:Uncharacterized protein n=2 Tax=Picea TaxID=3328 RepID=A0A124GP62_PICGL|nr:hypothetical protein ABT39_MTgene793 [Picea glauca]QHR91632.1 hypothetical protein Q903MT_gene5667 [Picea sitchensis]
MDDFLMYLVNGANIRITSNGPAISAMFPLLIPHPTIEAEAVNPIPYGLDCIG